jgi:hypothetical protein
MGINSSDGDDDALPTKEQGCTFDPQMTPERKKQKEMERTLKNKEIEKRSQPKEVWCKYVRI